MTPATLVNCEFDIALFHFQVMKSSTAALSSNCAPSLLSADGSLDSLCIATIRSLAIDMVEAASSGHPGAPIGLAPLAHVLFSQHFRSVGTDHLWMGRDRFVLSNGHACALQYAMLFLLGFPLSLDDLKSFRQLNSKTPGHPECHFTPGVEVTTGPLGQGLANAVGLAVAEAHLAATFNKPGFTIFNNSTFCIVGDGCMQEGVSAEAFSLAGHLNLSRLIVIYDDNGIQIDGSTDLAFSEDVDSRMKSYGFKVFVVENGNTDLVAISNAISAAKANTCSPSFIRIKTMIGVGSAHQGTEKVHGSPLGASDAAACKKLYFGKSHPAWYVPGEVKSFYAEVLERNNKLKENGRILLRHIASITHCWL
ncbi:Transketolase [Mitosporidium daphniae]